MSSGLLKMLVIMSCLNMAHSENEILFLGIWKLMINLLLAWSIINTKNTTIAPENALWITNTDDIL